MKKGEDMGVLYMSAQDQLKLDVIGKVVSGVFDSGDTGRSLFSPQTLKLNAIFQKNSHFFKIMGSSRGSNNAFSKNIFIAY